MTVRSIYTLLLAALLLAACTPAATLESIGEGTGEDISLTVQGTLIAHNDTPSAAGIAVALCRSVDGGAYLPADCTLLPDKDISDAAGHFTFEDVEPGVYFVLYESGLADFDAALAAWGGRTLRPGDWAWVRDDLLGLAAGEAVNLHVPLMPAISPPLDRTEYGLHTLLLGESPFVLAHHIEAAGDRSLVRPVTVEVGAAGAAPLSVLVTLPHRLDPAALRETVGPLAREEIALLDRDLAARWAQFHAGDDSALRDSDALAIMALRAGAVHRIGNLFIAPVEEYDGRLLKAVGYSVIDPRSGQSQIAAWVDAASGDVIEARTGYRLNVRDNPGVWIAAGPAGEQFYHYGFSYYRRWGRVLPDPVIDLLESFYTRGAAYVAQNAATYAQAAASHGGDLRLIAWDDSTAPRIRDYLPNPAYAPWVILPDSGTVDIRRERFLQAQIEGRVVVEEGPLADFLSSEVLQASGYNPNPDRQDVIDTLLTPYRSGHLFSDLEAAIILGATYGGGEEPLRVRIAPRLSQGFMVPRSGEKVILVAPDEAANVLLGYPGALNSRWGHEMAHVIDFRSAQYVFQSAGGRVCEPVKYIMEFMWWVQRYPGDAPDVDWLPINSGLALARLLTESFHNSGC
ncbi:MAG: hypothetical protein Kow00124_24080 [Anaerolineae bacterium]